LNLNSRLTTVKTGKAEVMRVIAIVIVKTIKFALQNQTAPTVTTGLNVDMKAMMIAVVNNMANALQTVRIVTIGKIADMNLMMIADANSTVNALQNLQSLLFLKEQG